MRHWLSSHLPGAKQGEVKGVEAAPLWEDKLCLLSGLCSRGLVLSLSHGGYSS